MSDARTLTFTVKGQKWQSREVLRKRRVKLEKADSHYSYSEASAYTISDFEGDFIVTIDVPTIIAAVVQAAAHNRSGRTRLLSGKVQCRRWARRLVSSKIEEKPLMSGYVEVPS